MPCTSVVSVSLKRPSEEEYYSQKLSDAGSTEFESRTLFPPIIILSSEEQVVISNNRSGNGIEIFNYLRYSNRLDGISFGLGYAYNHSLGTVFDTSSYAGHR